MKGTVIFTYLATFISYYYSIIGMSELQIES